MCSDSAFSPAASIVSGIDMVLNMYSLEGRKEGSEFLKGYNPIKIDKFGFFSSHCPDSSQVSKHFIVHLPFMQHTAGLTAKKDRQMWCYQ